MPLCPSIFQLKQLLCSAEASSTVTTLTRRLETLSDSTPLLFPCLLPFWSLVPALKGLPAGDANELGKLVLIASFRGKKGGQEASLTVAAIAKR